MTEQVLGGHVLTYVGVTWGSGNYQPGAPGASDVACNGQLADVVSTAPAGSWDLFWWSCRCPSLGRNSAALSDQNQTVVKGYNR